MNEIKKNILNIFEEAKKNPGALFGILYPYLLIVFVITGLYYAANIGDVALNKQPGFVPDTTVQKDLPMVEARTVPPVDIFKMKSPTQELVEKGKELYTKNCASCHNETGAGGGPASVGLNPAPRNFTSPDGWKNGRTLSAVYTTLEEGIQGSAMISYNFLTPQERIDLAHYIRQTFMKDPPADKEEDLTALNSVYSLSSGMEVPAQIPVEAAMKIIAAENSQKESKFKNALEKLKRDKNSYEAGLFAGIVCDKNLALSALINSVSWKENENTFFSFVITNSTYSGFNTEIIILSESDISLLHNYLVNLL